MKVREDYGTRFRGYGQLRCSSKGCLLLERPMFYLPLQGLFFWVRMMREESDIMIDDMLYTSAHLHARSAHRYYRDHHGMVPHGNAMFLTEQFATIGLGRLQITTLDWKAREIHLIWEVRAREYLSMTPYVEGLLQGTYEAVMEEESVLSSSESSGVVTFILTPGRRNRQVMNTLHQLPYSLNNLLFLESHDDSQMRLQQICLNTRQGETFVADIPCFFTNLSVLVLWSHGCCSGSSYHHVQEQWLQVGKEMGKVLLDEQTARHPRWIERIAEKLMTMGYGAIGVRRISEDKVLLQGETGYEDWLHQRLGSKGVVATREMGMGIYWYCFEVRMQKPVVPKRSTGTGNHQLLLTW